MNMGYKKVVYNYGLYLLLLLDFLYWINAAAPEFQSPTLTVDLPESLIVGGQVTSLQAFDADGDIISYTAASVNPHDADGLFNVAVSGEVTTTALLDYETETKYTIVVRATANGQVAEQTIYITVINVNEAPQFEGTLLGVTADHGATEGDLVTVVLAEDPDKTTDTVYTITDGNADGEFSIGQSSGIISVSPGSTLNRTVTSAYALTIEAADNGQPPKTGTTTLVIGICNGSGLSGISVPTVISLLFSVLVVNYPL